MFEKKIRGIKIPVTEKLVNCPSQMKGVGLSKLNDTI